MQSEWDDGERVQRNGNKIWPNNEREAHWKAKKKIFENKNVSPLKWKQNFIFVMVR